ncbi:hypothetical protein ACJIZ3_024498 [Penstemon smallii]|uniref:Exostosin GT47 domain-containing protein n=1 Tax=Penstemon smallii TaxID=265156 RepID=A0ABD3TSX0_9LAMI
MNYSFKIQTLLQIEKRKWLFLVCLVALTHLFCQSLLLPYKSALLSLLPDSKDSEIVKDNVTLNNESVMVKSYNEDGDVDDQDGLTKKHNEEKIKFSLDGNTNSIDNDFDFVEDGTLGNINVDTEDSSLIQLGGGESNVSTSVGTNLNVSFDKIKEVNDPKDHLLLGSNFATSRNGSTKPIKKKMRCEMPPKTVLPLIEMQKLLVRHRARSRAMRPRWSSERDKEIMMAKLKIEETTPIMKNDRDLYAPLFRNISEFKRSYELMEQILKIYVYKEGEKPIFHQPILKGLYASEGWFMKLMEGNNHFVVKDPRKAHLFYMPFSSRMLEYTIYVRNSHNRTNLRQYLKDYSEKIAAKYRFWNRTGGADHFLVACHDWAPYETRHHMEHCIKALCNADVTMGFKIGRDVSFPETYVRSARNPLRDLGGKPPSQRHILAFYAGNMHGYFRPILLKYWKDTYPDMKILGPMPPGVTSKMNYIQHMKSSKYCICPKGYEVNSPRIVESIFYECVPVIISDNFVPPFFEVLNWDEFSVIIAEKDVQNLRSILVSIPEEKYVKMQLGVRKVQRHFLWHAKPERFDLFHMTLHSIWYNRVFQMKLR